MYKFNLICDLCNSQICDQEHLLQCNILKMKVPELDSNTKVKYSDIFGDIESIIPAIKLMAKVIKRREELLEEIWKLL